MTSLTQIKLHGHQPHLNLAGLAHPRQLQPIDYTVLYGWLLKQSSPMTRAEVQKHWHPTWTLDEVDCLLQELTRLAAVTRHCARMGAQHDTFSVSAGAFPSNHALPLPRQLAVPKGGHR